MVEDESPATMCDTCNTPCCSNECMEAHKTKRGRQSSSMCDTMLFCPDCLVKLCNYKKERLGVEQTHLWQMLLLQLQVHLPS